MRYKAFQIYNASKANLRDLDEAITSFKGKE